MGSKPGVRHLTPLSARALPAVRHLRVMGGLAQASRAVVIEVDASAGRRQVAGMVGMPLIFIGALAHDFAVLAVLPLASASKSFALR